MTETPWTPDQLDPIARDLYEALERITRATEKYWSGEDKQVEIALAIKTARAALAKARGEG